MLEYAVYPPCNIGLPICIAISPIAHAELLHTDTKLGFKFFPSKGIISPKF